MPFPTSSLLSEQPSLALALTLDLSASPASTPNTQLHPDRPALSTQPPHRAPAHHHHLEHKGDHDRLSIASASTSTLASPSSDALPLPPPPPPPARNDRSSLSSRSANHGRRYTLSRFPLLRKGSRELTRTPSVSSTASTTASSSSKSPADALFHSTGAPRSSHSIAREPPTSAHYEGDAIAEEADPSPRLLHRPRAHDKPDKMHQTSSRLLRMTDDERPFTKVSKMSMIHHHHHCLQSH